MQSKSSFPSCPWYFGVPFGFAGFALLTLTVFCAQGLNLGTSSARIVVGLVLFLLGMFALFLLRSEGMSNTTSLFLLLFIATALYLRLLCLDHTTYDYEMFLADWVESFRTNGGFAALKEPVGNYNVSYLYFLAAISYLNIPDLYLIKLLSILFDILLAWAGLRLSRQLCRDGSPAPLVCFGALLFLPTVTLNGSYWGQCDSLYAALIVLAVSCVLERRPKLSVILLAIAFSFKLQTVFLIPLWCVFWYAKRIKFRHLFLFPVAYLVTIVPALALGKPIGDILGIYLGQTGEYSEYLTLNAPSVFAFLPHEGQFDTALLSKIGIIAAFVLVFTVLILLFIKRKRITDDILLSAAVVLAIGVPFLLPNMHERYFILADVFALVWACTNRHRIPIAALVQVSSLSSYCTYLNLRYTLPLYINGQFYVMAFEASLMLIALIWSVFVLVQQWKQLPKAPQITL